MQVLSLQSNVLRRLFADLQPGSAGSGSAAAAAEAVLEAPFQDSSLLDVALFLRLTYWPDERTSSSNLTAAHDSLPSVLRLAHKLDAPRMFAGISTHMAGWDPRGRSMHCL